jgi:YidC/Oxa1 family membrane protein insertase
VIGLAVWQDLLRGLGWVLARLYDLIPSYAVSIIVLTVFIRLLLLPLGIKQIRSMQAMAALQPKVKALQQKHKGNRVKMNEELQKLYQEHNVNPLSGCLPMILQLPVLIALYSVLRFPLNVGGHLDHPNPPPQSHVTVGSHLYDAIIHQQGDVKFLQCSAGQAGTGVQDFTRGKGGQLFAADGREITNLDCGKGIPIRIPYYVLALLMVASTYFQTRQMQRANPVGSQQQQAFTRIMPLLFGVWGFLFPAGLVVYWTTSNLWQIGQQHFIIRARKNEEQAIAEGRKAPPAPRKRGFMASMMERAQDRTKEQGRGPGSGRSAEPRGTGSGSRASRSGGSRSGDGGGGNSKGGRSDGRPRAYRPSATGSAGSRTAPRGTKSPLGQADELAPRGGPDGSSSSGGGKQQGSSSGSRQRSSQSQSRGGSRNAGSRKKRRKR